MLHRLLLYHTTCILQHPKQSHLDLNQPHQGDIACRKVAAPHIDQHEYQGACQKWKIEERQYACSLWAAPQVLVKVAAKRCAGNAFWPRHCKQLSYQHTTCPKHQHVHKIWGAELKCAALKRLSICHSSSKPSRSQTVSDQGHATSLVQQDSQPYKLY